MEDTRGLKDQLGGLRQNFGGHLHVVDTGEAETSCGGAEDLPQRVEDAGGPTSQLGRLKRTYIIPERTIGALWK